MKRIRATSWRVAVAVVIAAAGACRSASDGTYEIVLTDASVSLIVSPEGEVARSEQPATSLGTRPVKLSPGTTADVRNETGRAHVEINGLKVKDGRLRIDQGGIPRFEGAGSFVVDDLCFAGMEIRSVTFRVVTARLPDGSGSRQRAFVQDGSALVDLKCMTVLDGRTLWLTFGPSPGNPPGVQHELPPPQVKVIEPGPGRVPGRYPIEPKTTVTALLVPEADGTIGSVRLYLLSDHSGPPGFRFAFGLKDRFQQQQLFGFVNDDIAISTYRAPSGAPMLLGDGDRQAQLSSAFQETSAP